MIEETPSEYWTVPELATRAGVSKQTVWAWIRSGKLKSLRVGSQHRVAPEEWDKFIHQCND